MFLSFHSPGVIRVWITLVRGCHQHGSGLFRQRHLLRFLRVREVLHNRFPCDRKATSQNGLFTLSITSILNIQMSLRYALKFFKSLVSTLSPPGQNFNELTLLPWEDSNFRHPLSRQAFYQLNYKARILEVRFASFTSSTTPGFCALPLWICRSPGNQSYT